MEKIIFCGFGRIGENCLNVLKEKNFKVEYILTHKSDEAGGVDYFAKKNNIRFTYKDARENLHEIRDIIQNIEPKYLISVNYRYIIPHEIFEIPEYAFNIHGSLLPKYRGRTPHVWSIINGEDVTGITSHLIDKFVDTGNIIKQKRINIEKEDTGYSLLCKFEKYYPKLLIESIDILRKNIKLSKQDHNVASYYGKRTPDMGYVDFNKYALEVINFVRALAEPYPGAYYYLVDGRKIIINKVMIANKHTLDVEVGVIKFKQDNLYVKCKDQLLKIVQYRIIN
ncbi:methionyl-tRNA formyltransferase [Amphibacillus jilinensis]|uniref:methionyl-tRNA formyltransferase n=1 Tax=Amphibacillus jilinensis TaxID=1216008 RepID=UPI0003041357|nr:methionyl-tRNA formyltransferase [Amphibacillus jilinensis]